MLGQYDRRDDMANMIDIIVAVSIKVICCRVALETTFFVQAFRSEFLKDVLREPRFKAWSLVYG